MSKTTLINGYIISRGSCVGIGSHDDNCDEWYVELAHTRYVDRRGRGFATKREAYEYAKTLKNGNDVVGRYE